MECRLNIKDKIHWIGVNDRETTLFENYWPLEKGVAYNSYIINDDKVAILDTVKFNKTTEYLEKIKEIIGDKPVDYLIVNHMEPDHSGSMLALLSTYPEMKIVGNKKTFPFIEGFYGITKNFYEVGDGDSLELGHHKLTFHLTPMVHWPETMMTYDETSKVLFSMDAFGGFGSLDGGIFDDEINYEFYEDETRRYYSNIVAKYSPMVQRALKKVGSLDIQIVAPTHGPVWRTNPGEIISLYDKWSRFEAEEGVVIIYGSMYGNTAKMADYLARIIAEQGIKNVKVFDASKTHTSYILSDVWKYKSVVIGSCAYNTKVFSSVATVLEKFRNSGLKDRYVSVFGNKSWSGGGVSGIDAFVEEIGWEKIGQSIEATYSPKEAEFKALQELGKEIAARLKTDYPE
ncbi:FprA family A-type flavoprotein [Fusibacter ferrireducens]|uniref:FprA family A-type flavoprotein n=1 Tax=Fusibacter ferrireducens TaxID=2785058 RepID=A0ABR9ZYY4_9FIRM|nr:FprA family A-type flavoprotein [Fusibacter ferrireducens]MBF4695662.1 FprA family A-type flavoprotein [Fusibacter ferrireducens]